MLFPDGNSISGLVGNINEIFANQNLIATTKSAPSGTFVEIQTIEWFRKLVGYPVIGRPEDALGAGGAFVFGGTMANTISLMAAREKAFPGCKKKGLTSFNEKPVLLVAENTINHYSHAGAFGWLGLGEDNIVEVSITEDFRLDQNDLKKKLKKYKNDSGYKIIALVAQAGDSRTTTIEDFDAISKITKQFGVWLHVDACHGGVLIFSNKHKHKLKGMELADSISMDPHKGLAVTYPASLVLVKDRESLGLIAKHTDITINKGSFDLGQMTPMIGSKPFIALKLWFLIKSLGIKNIGKIIDSRMDLAQSWKRKIDDSKYFRSLNDIELNSVVFSLCPKKIKTIDDSKKLSELNKALHDAVYKDGYMCIHNFDIVDYKNVLKFGKVKIRTLGAIFGNPLTDEYDFNAYINYLESVAERYIR